MASLESIFWTLLLLVGIPVVLVILRLKRLGEQIEGLSRRLGRAERELFDLKERHVAVPQAEELRKVAPTTESTTFDALLAKRPPITVPPLAAEKPGSPPPAPSIVPPATAVPPPLPPLRPPKPTPVATSTPSFTRPTIEAPQTDVHSEPAINWEQFMGVKGFAWIGGFALFLGIVFAIQYAFSHHLVSPELQAGSGFLVGFGLLVAGVRMSRRDYVVLSQTLCATGVVVLYTVTFACRAYYHFEFFGSLPTFFLMVLITVTAFLLAVRLNGQVIAILGMLGGFLTPILISTGKDNPFGLFGYIAVLDVGLILVAVRCRWAYLTALAALGTAVLEVAWADKFFEAGQYYIDNKIFIPLGVLLLFNALYLAAARWAGKWKGVGDGGEDHPGVPTKTWICWSGLGLAALALGFAAWFISFREIGVRPGVVFSFVFLIDMIVLGVPKDNTSMANAFPLSGMAAFLLLGTWTDRWLSNDLLNFALAFYFLFAVLHSALPIFRMRKEARQQEAVALHLFPVFALVLVLMPIFRFTPISFIVWPFILLLDLLAIVLAVMTSIVWAVVAVLLLTLGATGLLIFKLPAELYDLTLPFSLLAIFVVFFVVAGVWLARRYKPTFLSEGFQLDNRNPGAPENLAAILPACSVVMPFLLLMMATLRLSLIDPTPVFGLALLLTVLLLGVTRLFALHWMPLVGLVCVVALESAWHFNHFAPTDSHQPVNAVLAWYLLFYAIFTVFPFLFLRFFSESSIPWIASAVSGPLQFFLVHRFMKAVYPMSYMGLLPAIFAIPDILGLILILKRIPADAKKRMTQVALFGGSALFFVTLIFPIQFDRQWITIGWALEGTALLWLFHRVAHEGLRLTGVALLGVAFIRLALNPAVLSYHAQSTRPIFNWYLYAYGIVALCLFVGAKLLAKPRHLVFQVNTPTVLVSLGTVLTFLLLNIEIADYFGGFGNTLTFEFSGNFARDMTYSIAWALFALALLVVGICKGWTGARISAMGLLGVTLCKLFFHDLAQLGQLYRIGAFIGVAIVAMIASFAYQKHYASTRIQTKVHEHSP